MKKIIKIFLLGFLLVILVAVAVSAYFYFSFEKEENPEWGINFSQKHSFYMGLDWQSVYLAILDDLNAKKIKIAVSWDIIEKEDGVYDFSDLDWQIKEAKKREAEIMMAIGFKTPRWPECHIPNWAQGFGESEQKEKVLTLVKEIISKYKEEKTIISWQVENEPFFQYGQCPKIDEGFLKKEIELVKSLDSLQRPVVISDSGEWSFWFKPAKIGDVVGVTMYRKVWFKEWNRYVDYPIPAAIYRIRAGIIKKIFNKDVVCVELQAEPWGQVLLYDSPREEQEKTMNLAQFKKNIEFARKTGLKEFYLWGAEWMYQMKEKQQKPEIWEEAKKLF